MSLRLLPVCAVAACLCFTACAFHFDEIEAAPGSCKSDDDCSDIEICSDVTNTCEVVTPDARTFALEGGFRCLSGLEQTIEAQLGSVGLAFRWDDFGTFTADSASVTGRCQSTIADGNLLLVFDGSRYFDSNFGTVGFHRIAMVLPADAVSNRTPVTVTPLGFPGTGGQSVFAGIYFCPAVPQEQVWFDALSVEGCLQLFDIVDGQVMFTRATESAGVATVEGYMVFPIVPAPEAL